MISVPNVVLLGDSIFDNGVYVRPGPDVAEQLRQDLPAGWTVTLRAVDGDPADYANPIEPSVRGGEKIAAAISAVVLGHDFRAGRAAIFR